MDITKQHQVYLIRNLQAEVNFWKDEWQSEHGATESLQLELSQVKGQLLLQREANRELTEDLECAKLDLYALKGQLLALTY